MGYSTPDSGIEIRRHTSLGFDAILYYGGGTSQVPHVVPTDANDNDVRIPRDRFEPLMWAAVADQALDAGTLVLNQAMLAPKMPPEYHSWWVGMPQEFRAQLVETLADTAAWRSACGLMGQAPPPA